MRTSTLLCGLLLAALPALAGLPANVTAPPVESRVEFLANRNQWEKPVLFAANVPGGRLFLTPGRLVQALYDAAAVEAAHDRTASANQPIKAHAYSVTFVGANALAAVQGEDQRSAHTSFFLGNDPQKWASNVPAYGAVRYQALYPGTDLRLYSRENQVEYDFELAPGADAARIRLRYDGPDRLQLEGGALHVTTSVGTVVEQRPYAYQLLPDGRREAVPCEYVLGARRTVSFALPRGYDHRRPLVIDPVLVYSSYSGSVPSNWGYSSTYDAQGKLYCGGIAFGMSFPTTVGAYSVTFAGNHDLAIMKFNPSAATGPASLVYATYLGGASTEHPHSLLVDAAGNLLIYGSTSSTDYPTTPGAYDTSFNGFSDIVVTRLNATGSALLASTFIGGTGTDGQIPLSSSSSVLYRNFGDGFRGDLALDPAGNVYVASNTQSTNFPVVGGVQSALAGTRDAAVFKLTPSLAGLQWSTYLGGSGEDAAYSIQVDSLSNVFVCGGTQSTNFPGTTGGLRPTYGGGITDGFVARLSAAGNRLVQSTYLGTSGYDQAYFLQLDRQGQVYVLGQTDGPYPVSAGVYSNPNSLQFIHKLRPGLTSDYWSTVVGNGRINNLPTNISPTAFLVDNCGQILLSGYGNNINNMPVTADAIKQTPTNPNPNPVFSAGNGDFYIMELSANAGRLVYGTYFGNGTLHVDGGASRFDKSGVIYQTVCASGGSGNPATTSPNAWARVGGVGGRNALAFKIDVGQLNAGFLPTNVPTGTTPVRQQCAPALYYFNRTSVTGTRVRWNFGNGQTSTQTANVSALYTIPGTYLVRLTVYDSTNCLQSVATTDTVRIYAGPQARITSVRGPLLCQATPTTLTGTTTTPSPSAVYTWSPATGLNTTNGPSVTATPSVSTLYTLTISSPGGCSSRDTVTVRRSSRPPLQVAFTPLAQPTGGAALRAGCAPLSVYFRRDTPQAGTSLQWNFGDGTTSAQAGVLNHVYATPGRYGVRLTVNDGATCPPTLTAVDTIVVYAMPVALLGPNQVICQGASVRLAAGNAGVAGSTYRWSPATGLNTATGASVTATPAVTTVYSLTATAPGGCSAQATVEVRVNPQPQALPGAGAREAFTSAPVVFSNASTSATDYFWDFGDGQSSTAATPTHTYSQPGNYPVRLVARAGNSGCVDEKSLNLVVRNFELPNIITPNNDGKNDSFSAFVSFAPIGAKIYNRWGRLVFEKTPYVNEWGDPSTAGGVYFYYLTGANGATWKGWVEVVH